MVFWFRMFALGLGYFGAQLVWGLYNAYLPLLYGTFIASNALIGLIMVIDNLAALTLQPAFAALSDRTETRLGRRLPFLLVGMPLTALFFALIPRADTLWNLLLATLVMNVGISIFSSPSLALMPDITPSPRRGRANGIINLMGGLGALVAFFALGPLYDRSPALPFDATAVILVVSLLVILALVPERRLALRHDGTGADHPGPLTGSPADGQLRLGDLGGLGEAVRAVLRSPDRRVLYLLLASLSWVAAVNGVQSMFTRYGASHWGQEPSEATFMLGYFALAFILFSIPAGMMGDRVGRLLAIRVGILGTLAAFVLLALLPGPALAPAVFLAGGISWALIISNAYPILVDLTPPDQAGTYTGLWNVVIALAGLVSPPVYGLVVDTLGFGAFFLPGVVFLALALWFSLRVGDVAAPPAGTGSARG